MAYTTAWTYYDVLDLNKSASRNDVKVAYHKMAIKHHPDKNPYDKRAKAKFQEVQEAYETLYDNGKRMQYNLKIGLNRHPPPRPPTFTATARSRDPTTPYNPPKAPKRPDWFWSDIPKPKEYNYTDYFTNFEKKWDESEDRGETHDPPEQDWFENWVKEQEKLKKQKQEELAQKLKEQKERNDAKLPQTLTVTLQNIIHLDAKIKEIECQRRIADIMIEMCSFGVDGNDEGSFFDELYQKNISLNSLQKEFMREKQKYVRLCMALTIRNPQKGAEAEQKYTDWKKRSKAAENKRDDSASDLYEKQMYEARHYQSFEEKKGPEERRKKKKNESHRRRAEEDELANEEYRRQQASWHYVREEEEIRKSRSTSPEERPRTDSNESCEPATTNNTTTEFPDEAQAHQDEVNESSDDEVIFIRSRIRHSQHSDVTNELWEIADGSHACCFCARTSTVFSCPEYDQCGLKACETCRRAPLRR